MMSYGRDFSGYGERTTGNDRCRDDGLQESIGGMRGRYGQGSEASEGVVDSYIHGGGRIGVLIEVNCETDFVARNEQFRTLVHELAMQVAAANPSYVRREEVPADVIAKEEQILLAQAVNEGKPEHIAAKIVAGRMEKFFQESCLMEQPFFRDQDKTVQDVVNDYIALIGENIMVRRFCRFAIGE
jgi:elongation factor Ts